MTEPVLQVSEVFGPTFQGEGPSAGMRCAFLRLAQCNLRCVWCDTKYTWDWKNYDPSDEITRMKSSVLVATMCGIADVDAWVVSGGEPLIQQAALACVLRDLAARWVEVETAGTLAPGPGLLDTVNRFNVSPKLRHSGNDMRRAYKPLVLMAFRDTAKAIFKFVVQEPSDLDEVEKVVADVGIADRDVWIMPEGVDSVTLRDRMTWLPAEVLARNWNLTGRMQVDLWGAQRGH